MTISDNPIDPANVSPPERDRHTRQHILLTVLGTNPSGAEYTLHGTAREASLAPLALLELLPPADRPDRVLAICTPEAKELTWPILVDALAGRCQVDAVDVSTGGTQEEVNRYLSAVADAIPDGVAITVDVTHGFRHYSFLTYLAVLYLKELRDIEVVGAYYGVYNPGQPSPFLDLSPLLELPDWLYGVRVLRETGSAHPLAEALGNRPRSSTDTDMRREVSRLAEAHASALPLEFGYRAMRFLENRLQPLEDNFRDNHHLPLAAELVQAFQRILDPLALTPAAFGQLRHNSNDQTWKTRVRLARRELLRQAKMIDYRLELGDYWAAFGMMHEWTVSWVLWCRGQQTGWLDYPRRRKPAADDLGRIAAVRNRTRYQHELTPQQLEVGEFWQNLNDLRNADHHHGMGPDILVGGQSVDEKRTAVLQYWRATLRACPRVQISISATPGKRVLVSPIGFRPGSLYSAVEACRAEHSIGEPSLCIVICSEDNCRKVNEALRRANYQGPVERFVFKDAMAGLNEINDFVADSRALLMGAEIVAVNITGGTTLMGLAAEKIGSAARRLACPVTRFGLIDRRSTDEQARDPYETGDAFWLDAPGDDDGN